MMDALSSAEVWVFDLDNTLYPAACNLFAQVDRRIGQFIADRFGLPMEEARVMQKRFFRDHGTTLRGLMVEHGVDPVAYMDYVHDIDVTAVCAVPALDRALAALPGRKIIFTNGSVRHARNVTDRLGITGRFDAVFDIAAADYIPKPDPRPYRTLVDRYAVAPERAAMVEDIARNLVPAHALGMTTVWVHSDAPWSQPDPAARGTESHIHHTVEDLVAWLGQVAGTA